LTFIDLESGQEIVEYLTNLPTRFVKSRVPPDASSKEVQTVLSSMGWPEIRALVTPEDPGHGVVQPTCVFKGLNDLDSLIEAMQVCANRSHDGWVHLETDLRAHMNPSRMASIALVGDKLTQRLHRSGFNHPLLNLEA
jgi:hypothetical protein